MKISITLLLAILFLGTLPERSIALLDNSIPIHRLLTDYIDTQYESWQKVDTNNELSESAKISLLKEIIVLHVNYVKNKLSAYEDINQLPASISELNKFYQWKYIVAPMENISNMFKAFLNFLDTNKDAAQVSVSQARNFVTLTILQGNCVTHFNNLFKIVTRESFYQNIAKSFRDDMELNCQTKKSPHQLTFTVYSMVTLAQLKAFIMLQFSYMIFRTAGLVKFAEEADWMRQCYEERTKVTQYELIRIMAAAENIFLTCDPKVHEEGKTFVRLTQLLQGHFENEQDLAKDTYCGRSCSIYQDAVSRSCSKDSYCQVQRECKGRVRYCQQMENVFHVCPSMFQTERRYEFIEYESGRVLGKKQFCSGGTNHVERFDGPDTACAYCMCLCDEEGPFSDRYFSMRLVLSNVEENKVVTGLRFRKVNQIIHIQIQEGILGPYGTIVGNSTSWKEIDVFKITDEGVTNGNDYFTLNADQRRIQVGEIKKSVDRVVTGVRFVYHYGTLEMEVQTTQLNFITGQLINPWETFIWSSNWGGKKIEMIDPGVPTDLEGQSDVNWEPQQIIEFTHSGMEADAGQTTVPYLDAQDVAPLPPMPLSGVGLYHKTIPGNGGFIGPKIFTYGVTHAVRSPKNHVVTGAYPRSDGYCAENFELDEGEGTRSMEIGNLDLDSIY